MFSRRDTKARGKIKVNPNISSFTEYYRSTHINCKIIHGIAHFFPCPKSSNCRVIDLCTYNKYITVGKVTFKVFGSYLWPVSYHVEQQIFQENINPLCIVLFEIIFQLKIFKAYAGKGLSIPFRGQKSFWTDLLKHLETPILFGM